MVGQEHARCLRALALGASGRDAEALRWLTNGFLNTPGWEYYKAPINYVRAEIHKAKSRPEEARAARAAFEHLWSEADEDMFLPSVLPVDR